MSGTKASTSGSLPARTGGFSGTADRLVRSCADATSATSSRAGRACSSGTWHRVYPLGALVSGLLGRCALAGALVAALIAVPQVSQADSMPPVPNDPANPATVSSDALPTVQVD